MTRRKIFVRSYCGWMTACVLFLFCSAASPAQTFNTLTSFDGTDGAALESTVVQGTNGNFYGTTTAGGLYGMLGCSPCLSGGTIFEITPGGSLTTLYNFCAQPNCIDGSGPSSALVETSNGTFWGVTNGGGANGYGTVFKIAPGGTPVTMHSFDNTDGAYAVGLMQGSDGNFYGTTEGGGLEQYAGTIFKITPAGVFTTLHKFCSEKNCRDGSTPYVGLVQARDGNFYGTTISGGPYGGVIFKITAGGKYTVVNNLGVFGDGCYPSSVMVQATDGYLYGTFSGCGVNNGGTFFKMTTGGELTNLYEFCIGCADGRGPAGTFVLATDGNFYGTTNGGLGDQDSTIFQMTPAGTLTTLYTFDDSGNSIPAGLIQATNGTLYGTTYRGGTGGDGMIFSLSVGLGPFAQTLPTSGKVRSSVLILGNNLTGTTGVSFNGTAATFTVENDTEIKTTVPAGATTGYVTVSTPTGVLSSNVPFGVTK
jgi:uncharacterized repeat protein (TIGR03803 family)